MAYFCSLGVKSVRVVTELGNLGWEREAVNPIADVADPPSVGQ